MRMIALVIATLAGSLLLADARPARADTGAWTKVYDHPVDYATAIEMFDDQFGLAVIGHGIQRTTDGGLTWHETYSGEDAAGSIFIADEKRAWVVGTGVGNFLRTTDGGLTWALQSTPAPTTFSGVSVVSADEIWISAYQMPIQGFPPHGPSALLHSKDGGSTWETVDVPGYGIFLGVWFIGDDGWLLATQCHPGDPVDDPRAEPGAPGHAPCTDVQTLLHTLNGGESWSPLPRVVAATDGAILRIDRLHAYSLVGCRIDCAGRGLYKTDNGAQTWTYVGAPPLGNLDSAGGLRLTGPDGWLAVSQLDPPTIPPSSATYTDRLAHTGDGGHTWELVDAPRGWSRAFDLAGRAVIAGGGGSGVSRYDPAAREWQTASTDAGPDLTRFMFVTRDVGYATDRNYALWATSDGGATWSLRSDALNWNYAPDGVVWGFDKNLGIHLSDDGGRSTRELRHLPPGQPPASVGLVVAAAGDSVWLRRNDGLWRTDDAGATWRQVDAAWYAQYRFIDSTHAWTTSCGLQDCAGAIRVTEDGGYTWEVRVVPANAYIGDIAFTTPLDGWVPLRDPGGHCYCNAVTHDGGRSWQTVSTAPWPAGSLLWLDARRAWGLARYLPPAQPPVVVSTADGGASWREEFTLDRLVVDARLTQRAGRLWLYAGTTKPSFVDGAIETPRRLLIYRRDVTAIVLSAPSVGADRSPRRPQVLPLVALAIAGGLGAALGASLRRRTR